MLEVINREFLRPPLGRRALDSRTAKRRCFANGSGESVSFETRNLPRYPPRTNYDTTEIFGVTCTGISPQKFLRTPTWIPPTTSKTFDRQARLALNFHFVFNRDFHRCGGCGFPSRARKEHPSFQPFSFVNRWFNFDRDSIVFPSKSSVFTRRFLRLITRGRGYCRREASGARRKRSSLKRYRGGSITRETERERAASLRKRLASLTAGTVHQLRDRIIHGR